MVDVHVLHPSCIVPFSKQRHRRNGTGNTAVQLEYEKMYAGNNNYYFTFYRAPRSLRFAGQRSSAYTNNKQHVILTLQVGVSV